MHVQEIAASLLLNPCLERLLSLCACSLASLLVKQRGRREVYSEGLAMVPESWAGPGTCTRKGLRLVPSCPAFGPHGALAFSFILPSVSGRSLSLSRTR